LRPRCCAIVRAKVAVKFSILTHRALDILAALLHRMRRADGRARRHRSHVRSFSNEHARGCGAGARRRYVNDHRQRCGKDRLDDLSAELSRPPGVSSWITNALAPSAFADASESSM